ncbi:pentapeptide repeat-containing protein [Actinoplanes sp. NPDC049596]|uniref:pentapeptide repeat-containing protein n=1 Tax=unclassified Actinoplanes TaxID=2626549 RepID=UPI00343AD062
MTERFDGAKFRTISWPVVAAGLAVIAGGTAALAAWLLGMAGPDPGRRLDAIKTAFTVGLAAGGTLALLLATRRQWLQERERLHAEHVAADTAERAERVAAAAERDAVERRMTELYVKAAEQLGSAKAAVRLAGLYALERLGQDNPGQRQVVMKVITSYLRMPFTRPSADATDDFENRQELEVRTAAQQIIAAHLSDRDETARWTEIDFIDLTGARLAGFSLQHCSVASLQLNEAVFEGETLFRAFQCGGLFAANTIFEGFADFRGAVFEGDAWLSWASFNGGIMLNADEFYPGAHFKRYASFQHSTFGRHTRFAGVTFSGGVNFTRAEFAEGGKTAGLGEVRIEDPQARSPEVGHAPSSWPEGWVVVVEDGGAARLRARRRVVKKAPAS